MAIMQTFRVKSGDEISEYVYLTKIDLFFKQKSPTFGITLDIGDVENGYPTGDMVPNGKVHLKASEVNISTDGQTATTFTFSSPLCVPTGGEFALNIMADNQNPDYILLCQHSNINHSFL